MNDQVINADLLGREGGVEALATPALLLDLDAFERNLAAMAAAAQRNGVVLRPHAKTHKCVEIARRQLAAGAIGISCAKLGEAEVMAEAGITGLLLTSPVVTPQAIGRLMALAGRSPDLMLVADDAANVERLAEAAATKGITLDLLVDLDVGQHRTGVASIADGVALAQAIAANPSLRLRGIQAYAGHAMHIAGREARRAVLSEVSAKIAALRDALAATGLSAEIITGGGTGSCEIDPEFRVFTELQVGSYVFMDREYDEIWSDSGERPPFEPALFVQTSVISASHAGFCTTDAGYKAFATEAGPPRIVSGAPAGALYKFSGDEQGRITFAEQGERLEPGSVVRCFTPHCDPTVNLYDQLHAIRGDRLEAIWPIDARGRSQ